MKPLDHPLLLVLLVIPAPSQLPSFIKLIQSSCIHVLINQVPFTHDFCIHYPQRFNTHYPQASTTPWIDADDMCSWSIDQCHKMSCHLASLYPQQDPATRKQFGTVQETVIFDLGVIWCRHWPERSQLCTDHCSQRATFLRRLPLSLDARDEFIEQLVVLETKGMPHGHIDF